MYKFEKCCYGFDLGYLFLAYTYYYRSLIYHNFCRRCSFWYVLCAVNEGNPTVYAICFCNESKFYTVVTSVDFICIFIN
jgi:hypothetical protein